MSRALHNWLALALLGEDGLSPTLIDCLGNAAASTSRCRNTVSCSPKRYSYVTSIARQSRYLGLSLLAKEHCRRRELGICGECIGEREIILHLQHLGSPRVKFSAISL